MEKLTLQVASRDVLGKKTAKLRADGKIPAVVYGHDVEPESLTIESKVMEKIYHQAGGNKIVDLMVDEAKAKNALIHDVQRDPRTGLIIHADFYVVNMKEVLRTEVPLHFIGESTAVYQDEGTLVKNIEEIEVECLPADLPESIEVDISILDDFDKTITVADLAIPEGVKVLIDDPEEMLVVKVDPPRSDEEMAQLDEDLTEELPEGVAEEDPAVVSEENEGDKDRRDKK
jgi:large subunit ribosomal protein L25